MWHKPQNYKQQDRNYENCRIKINSTILTNCSMQVWVKATLASFDTEMPRDYRVANIKDIQLITSGNKVIAQMSIQTQHLHYLSEITCTHISSNHRNWKFTLKLDVTWRGVWPLLAFRWSKSDLKLPATNTKSFSFKCKLAIWAKSPSNIMGILEITKPNAKSKPPTKWQQKKQTKVIKINNTLENETKMKKRREWWQPKRSHRG